MKNYYALLGFDRVVDEPDQVAEALAKLSPHHPEAAPARAVLGDPTHKARYDWILRAALKLARSRQHLGLRADPFLPRADAWGTASTSQAGISRGNRPPMNWIPGVALGALLLSLVAFWRVSTPPVATAAKTSPAPEIRIPIADPQVAVTAQKERVPETHNPELPFPGLEQMPPPRHGTLQSEPGSGSKIPWQITTVPGQDYFLILSEAQTQRTVLTLYLHGGEPFLGMVPEGDYSLAYTTGFYWYGLQHRFGPGARMLKAERPFRVVPDPDNSPVWELNLRPASGSDPLFTIDNSERAVGH